MLFPYSKELISKNPWLFDSVQESYFKDIILWVLDTNYRKASNLRNWIKDLLENPSLELSNAVLSITSKESPDEQVMECLRYVKKNITYKSDKVVWSASDKWQTPTETLTKKTGDCEDGAILLYSLCRLKGVPINRLLLLCGDVEGGGHCWLGYKPQQYPLNYAFLDWCYWYNNTNIDTRNKFYIQSDSNIKEYKYTLERTSSNYYKVWFGFNEQTNIKNFKYNSLNRK